MADLARWIRRTVMHSGPTRWEGKPFSGRLVYSGRAQGEWWWQCDLCGAPDEDAEEGPYPTMQAAFADAHQHAAVYCWEVSR